MGHKMLQDTDGNTSSKRVAGFISLAGLFGVLAIVAVNGGDMEEFAWPLVTLIAALFSAGALEKRR